MDNYVITIARGYGSGGKTIGQKLAQKLNIPSYGREIIRLASEDSGINEKLFGRVDEKVRKPSLFRASNHVYKGELLPPESNEFVSDDNLFNYQAKVIKQLADDAPCVIIGRCADFILKDRPNVIRLFVYAPFNECVQTVMDLYGVNEREAKKRIQSIDKHRGDYYAYYTGHAWNNPNNYDLCINSSTLGFDETVNLIIDYLQCLQ